jgi:uncharacterized protein (TIGR02266 family)
MSAMMTGVGTLDQRVHQRFDANFLLYFAGTKLFGYAYTRNISAGGCFVETSDPAALGAVFDVEVYLDLGVRAIPMRAPVMVMWCNREARNAKMGMGLRFELLDATASEALQQALAFVAAPQLPLPSLAR